MNMTGGVDLET